MNLEVYIEGYSIYKGKSRNNAWQASRQAWFFILLYNLLMLDHLGRH